MSRKQWKKAIMLVWRHAAQHKYDQPPQVDSLVYPQSPPVCYILYRYANLFLHPVRDDDAPGYRDVIHRPMDLSSIKRNIENGVSCLVTASSIWDDIMYISVSIIFVLCHSALCNFSTSGDNN